MCSFFFSIVIVVNSVFYILIPITQYNDDHPAIVLAWFWFLYFFSHQFTFGALKASRKLSIKRARELWMNKWMCVWYVCWVKKYKRFANYVHTNNNNNCHSVRIKTNREREREKKNGNAYSVVVSWEEWVSTRCNSGKSVMWIEWNKKNA